MIVTDKNHADIQSYITFIGNPSLMTSTATVFYTGISVLDKRSPVYILTAHICTTCKNLL